MDTDKIAEMERIDKELTRLENELNLSQAGNKKSGIR